MLTFIIFTTLLCAPIAEIIVAAAFRWFSWQPMFNFRLWAFLYSLILATFAALILNHTNFL